jgi:hypothetical protein
MDTARPLIFPPNKAGQRSRGTQERIEDMIATHANKVLTPAEWQAFMVNQVVYIKPVVEEGKHAFAIHAADGTQLAILADHDTAFAAARSHDLEPVSVH